MAIANSDTLAWSTASNAQTFALPNYFGTIVVQNNTGEELQVTTDASPPGTGIGTLVQENNQYLGVYGNLLPLPNWNLAPNTGTADVADNVAPSFVGNSSPVYGTVQGQGGYGGLQITYTATNAAPAVFTVPTAFSKYLANGQVVLLTSAGVPTGFTRSTATVNAPYFMVNVSGATTQLALTSGGTGVTSSSTGSGTLIFAQTCCTVVPVNASGTPTSITGTATITFQ